MRKLLAAVPVVLALLLAGCGGSGAPDHAAQVKACKQVMRADFKRGMNDPNAQPRTARPAACVGVSDAELKQIIGQIMSEQLSGQ